MAAKKYLKQSSGDLVEQAATVTSAGAGNDGDIVALDSSGRLDTSVMPTGIAPDVEACVASETIANGALVNYFDSGAGVMKIRNADASVTTKRANGFVLVGGAAAATLNVYFLGRNTGVSGLTPAAQYFLSDSVPGGYTVTAPAGTGKIVQRVGVAITATDINIEVDNSPIVLA